MDEALTDDQAAVYDRQLRVWGVEVQRKLTGAKVFLVGFGQLAAEVAKNITLAGIGHVTLLDDTPAHWHVGRNFLITTAATDQQTSAEAAAKTLQAMNPLVKVSAAPGSISEAISNIAMLQQQDLVVAAGMPLHQVQQLALQCRQAKVGFMAGSASGPGGWYFVDLGEHRYVPKGLSEQSQQQTVNYQPFAGALTVPAAQLPHSTHPMYYVLQVLVLLAQEHQRPLTAEDFPAAQQLLHKAYSSSASSSNSSARAVQQQIAKQLLESFVFSQPEFAPVCAVLGGIIANNVVTAVSAFGAPLNNLLYYTLFDGRAIVECQQAAGAAAAAAKCAVQANRHRQAEAASGPPAEEAVEID